jgi:DNA-binding beta-propeller fold protein YncE
MNKLAITTAAALSALAAACVWGEWVYEGQWGGAGPENGQFVNPEGVAVGRGGVVYVADCINQRVQYFTPDGRFLGKWGTQGSGNGQFERACGVAPRVTGSRIYVSDHNNHRIQYFNRNEPAVAPTSLGRVKALFR